MFCVNKRILDFVDSWFVVCEFGVVLLVGDNLNYVNFEYSLLSNCLWIMKFDGLCYGMGKVVYWYGMIDNLQCYCLG